MSGDNSCAVQPGKLSCQCKDIFLRNRQWAEEMRRNRPDFFTRLMAQQSPKYMWIGCSDSRVPANQVMGLEPGEVFVHRNVANLFMHSDLNAMSTLQFAVERLKVEHVMVVGHYGCGGVNAALHDERVGLADNWIRHIQNTRDKYRDGLGAVMSHQRADLLCELNALTQALNVCHSTVVRDAWSNGQPLVVHAWVYGLQDGLLKDLGLSLAGAADVTERYEQAVLQAINRRLATTQEQLLASA
ncbi:MAG: carbonic anhydrase [Aquabacterium commune]|uniref:carbonic anhydrase n=1 Tax=Aquabacterium commune TaxID=70586 RepID=UPI003BB1477E